MPSGGQSSGSARRCTETSCSVRETLLNGCCQTTESCPLFVFFSDLSRSLADRWGTTVDFTTSSLHFLHSSRLFVLVCLLVACLPSEQRAGVCQGRICLDNCTCCHTEEEIADETCCLTRSRFDAGPTSPSADLMTPVPGRVASRVTGVTSGEKKPQGESGDRTRVCLTTGPTRRSL